MVVGLFVLLLTVFVLSSVTYSFCEGKSFWDSCWWAFMTFTTVGYGDQYPISGFARLAGIVLVVTAIFVVLPTATALVSRFLIFDRDRFSHEEQEEMKRLLRKIASHPTFD